MPDEVIRREETTRFGRGDLSEGRVSWGAVWAGVMAALGMEILFTLFGLFIDFALFNPATAGLNWGVKTWSAAWWLVTAFVSLYFGGWVTARLAGSERNGPLHAVATWGLAQLGTIVLLMFTAGTVVSEVIGMARTAAVTAATQPGMTPPTANITPYQAAGSIASAGLLIFLFLWLGSIISFFSSILGGKKGEHAGPRTGAEVSPRDRDRLAA